jgi:alpha-tubulin suppressor-like RCC1 family protein
MRRLPSYKAIVCPIFSFYYLNSTNKNQTATCYHDYSDEIKNNLIKKKTDLFIWGNGYINNTSVYTNFHPHRIKNLVKEDKGKYLPDNIMDISFGIHLAAVIDKNYQLFIWKEPKLNSEKDKSLFNNHNRTDVMRLADNLKVVNTSFTKDKLFILDKTGNVYFYNININQSRGEDFFENSLPPPEIAIEKDRLIHIKELKNISMIATGRDHFIALDKEGNVYGMGDDSYGQLGTGNFSKERELQMKLYYNFIERRERLPVKVKVNEKIKKVACGENHTLLLSEGGNVYGMGNNRYLQLSNDELYR